MSWRKSTKQQNKLNTQVNYLNIVLKYSLWINVLMYFPPLVIGRCIVTPLTESCSHHLQLECERWSSRTQIESVLCNRFLFSSRQCQLSVITAPLTVLWMSGRVHGDCCEVDTGGWSILWRADQWGFTEAGWGASVHSGVLAACLNMPVGIPDAHQPHHNQQRENTEQMR